MSALKVKVLNLKAWLEGARLMKHSVLQFIMRVIRHRYSNNYVVALLFQFHIFSRFRRPRISLSFKRF